MTSSIIKYRINSVTSESPQYPVKNLTDPSSLHGWQSDFSPSYPQEINIQFFTPIRTKTMKLTFHQYKIPSLVQVFVRLTSKQNYRKLGYIVPNDNSQSSYEHKQIKTLYFEFPCNYIKLVFYQNYKNEMNLFEQVALEDLIIQGQAMTYNEIKNLDLKEQASSADQSQSGQIHDSNKQNEHKNRPKLFPIDNYNVVQTAGMQDLNNRFNEVYAYLENKKTDAVEKEDFRLAGYLKNVIQTFKSNQNQIISLEIQKKQALEDQDFDKCHRIKLQIQKLKEQFQYRLEQLYQNEENFMAEYSHSRILPDPQRMTERKPLQPQQRNTDVIKNFVSSTPQRQYETSLGKNKSNQQQVQKKLSLNLNAQNVSNVSAINQNKSVSEKVVDHNEQIIPAVRNKILGIKQESIDQYPIPTNRSVFDQSKNYSSLRGVNSRGNLQQKSPRAGQNRSKSPPKSPTHKVVTKAKTLISVAQSNMSLKSPILSYEQLEYRQQTQIKQQTFSPSAKKKMVPENQDQQEKQRYEEFQALLDRLKRLEVEPLDLKLRMKLQSHFVIIPEPYWQMIMHKSWAVKKQALQYVRDNVVVDSKQAYMAVMQFISFSINDPHPQVLMTTLHILRKLIDQGNQNGVEFTLPHMPYFIETVVSALLNLINSTNKQLSQQAYNLYLMLGMIGFLTIQYLITKIIKHKQTSKVTPQFTVMKISLMISMIEKYQQSTKYFKEILLWSIEFLKDPNNKVRSEASYLILILADVIGEDRVVNVIKDKPQLMKLYLETLDNNSKLMKQGSSRVIESLSNLGDGSRLTDRNLSRMEDNASLLSKNKSLSKERGPARNKSQLSQQHDQNYAQEKQADHHEKHHRMKNPWTSKQEQSMKSQKSRSKIESQKNEDELQYSKESDFYNSSSIVEDKYGGMKVMQLDQGNKNKKLQEKNKKLKSQQENPDEQLSQSSEHWHRQESQYPGNYEGDNLEQDDEEQEDPGKCDYCFMDMHGMDQRQHLLTECKVLISCQQCMGRVYIRETIYHLLNQCTNHTYHQQCKKCGLVFNIDEINEHVGQGMCRLQRGQGWERCQFCGQDVMANDMKWVDHAYKCPNLPQLPEVTQKQSQTND